MCAYDGDAHPFLVEEKRFLRSAVDQGHPILGICLGCQLLADALGGRAIPGACLEFGYVPIRLNAAGQKDPVVRVLGQDVFSFHSDTWEPPPHGQVLAESADYPQAFRAGTALGIQFHPEPPPTLVRQWVEENETALREAGLEAGAVVAEAQRREARAKREAFQFFDAWLRTRP